MCFLPHISILKFINFFFANGVNFGMENLQEFEHIIRVFNFSTFQAINRTLNRFPALPKISHVNPGLLLLVALVCVVGWLISF